MQIQSEDSYLRKMRIILSFFFHEEDVKSIIYDYKEQFETGNKYNNHLKTPWRECQQILAESGTSPIRVFILQKKFRILLLLLLFILFTKYIALRCENSGTDFLLAAVIINFVISITAWIADADGIAGKQKFSKLNILLLLYTCIECLMIGIFVPVLLPYNIGKILTTLIVTVAMTFVAMVVFLIIESREMQGYALIIHHISTIVLCTLYFVSQMHIMQSDIETFSFHIITGAICIYCESIVLYLLRKGGKPLRNKLWMHN